MMPRLAILVGLLAGIVVAGLILGGIYALAPESPTATQSPTATPTATATPEVSSAPANTTSPPSEDPLVGTSASPSASSSGSQSASPSGGSLFHVGEPAPALVVPQVGGGTIDLASLKGKPVWVNFVLPVHFWIGRDGIVRDGALGGIGPDIMARGLQTIRPGVTVTP